MQLHSVTLKCSLSLWVVSFYGLGTILGAGIYVLVGKVVGVAGLLASVSFLVASLIAACSAASFTELSSRYPVSAGEAAYIDAGFNRRWLPAITGSSVVVVGVFLREPAPANVMHVSLWMPWMGLLTTLSLMVFALAR